MKEKLRNLFDEMKVRSRYKSMNAIIDMIEPLINQEVEKRIKERMPNKRDTEQARTNVLQQYLVGNISLYDVVCQTESFYCSRLTCSEKPNNSQKTEGGAK